MPPFWSEIETIFNAKACLPVFQLNPGASGAELAALEAHLGVALPDSLRGLLALHNGQAPSSRCGLFFGLEFLSTDGIRLQWDNWRTLDGDGMNEELADSMSSRPDGFIKPHYLNRLWIPFTHDGGGNHTGIDFDPDAKGSAGQVIAFGRDEDEKKLLAPSFDGFIATFVRQLKAIDWSIEGGRWQFDDQEHRRHFHEWDAR